MAPARVRAAVRPEGEPHQEIVEAIFAEVPDAPRVSGGVPDLVRRNRRERAKRRLVDALDARGPYPVPEVRRAELRMIARRWAQKGFADTFAEAEDLEVRFADERAVLEAEREGNKEERIAAAERTYLRAVEKKHGGVEIRGLQLPTRVYQDLEDTYVPLYVEDRSELPLLPKKARGAKATDVDAITAMVRRMARPRVAAVRALAKHPRLLLTGGPGSGKSTLLAHLATRSARGGLAAETGWPAEMVPFLMPVRSLSATPVTVESLAIAAGAEPWFLEAMLRAGRALLLIDGLDEARREVAGGVMPMVAEILDAHPGVRALATTRPSGAMGEEEAPPAGFVRVQLAPMTRDEVKVFIDKWCLAAEIGLGKTPGIAEADAQAAATDLKELVRHRSAIEKLTHTPLLCSVICAVHRFLGQQVPQRRVVLYEAITNVLLYEWDRSKLPHSIIGTLDAQQKRTLLSHLALSMQKDGVVELAEAKVVACFEEHLPAFGPQLVDAAAALLAEIRDRNGVLVERAPGMFAFSHLTFQEYLAAMRLVETPAYDVLLEHHEDKDWHEVIVLAAGFPGADAARIVRGLLEADGEEVATGTMLAAQCVETAIQLPPALRKEIEDRVARLVPPRTLKSHISLLELGDVAGPILLQALERADPHGKACILDTLGVMNYGPAAGAISKFLSDASELPIPVPPGLKDRFPSGFNLAALASVGLVRLLQRNEDSFSPFLAAMPNADPVVSQILDICARDNDLLSVRPMLLALLRRYEETHPKAPSSALRSPRRAARTG